MDNFYLTLVTVFIMVILITIIKSNKNLSRETRKGLTIACFFVIIGETSEWICQMITKFNGILFIELIEAFLRLIKFQLMPLMPIILSRALFENGKKSKFNKIIWAILKTYILLEYILSVVNFIKCLPSIQFYQNTMYITILIVSTAYIFYNAFHFNKKCQNRYQLALVEIMLLVTIGATIQLGNWNIKTFWITISVDSTFLYIYYIELVQYLDKMTGLLNWASLCNYIDENENKRCVIIIMDVNNFKDINDNYGHEFGDKILIEVSKIIKETYQKYGKCYRMGGDEFAVIMQTSLSQIDSINEKFISSLKVARLEIPELPHVSWGYSEYNPENRNVHSLKDTKEEADNRMYENKRDFKKNTSK